MNPEPLERAARASSRRGFFRTLATLTARTVLAGGALAGLLGLRRSRTASNGERGSLGILRPPGSANELDFLTRCIRCTRCADVCEVGCIRLFGPEGGSLQGTPYIFPHQAGCNLCLRCGQTCPTEAIVPLEDFRDARMGVAAVDERLCVSHNGTGVCGACHTVCPVRNRAITQDLRNAPRVHPEHCTGCGLCEEACIVRDRRAIQVRTERAGTTAIQGTGL